MEKRESIGGGRVGRRGRGGGGEGKRKKRKRKRKRRRGKRKKEKKKRATNKAPLRPPRAFIFSACTAVTRMIS